MNVIRLEFKFGSTIPQWEPLSIAPPCLLLVFIQKENPFIISTKLEYAPIVQCTEEKIENVFSTLDNSEAQFKSQEITDFKRNTNAKVSKDRDGEILVKFGRGSGSERRETWVPMMLSE